MKLVKLQDKYTYAGTEEPPCFNLMNILKANGYSQVNIKRFKLVNLKKKNNTYENT